QENDPCEPNAGLEFRTQRQTEFLLEALRLQTGQKLTALQTESGMGCGYGNDLVEDRARLTTILSLNSIRNNFRDIQRNLEIWLARIIGNVEGSDGARIVESGYVELLCLFRVWGCCSDNQFRSGWNAYPICLFYYRIPKKRDDLKHKEEIKENKITPMEITMVAQFCPNRMHELIAEEWDKQQCCRAAFRGLILKCRQSNGQSSSFNKETSEGMRENEVDAGLGDAVQGKTSQTDLSAVLNAGFLAGFYTSKWCFILF
ncbi:hypothetical protein Tco_0585014, partial [Tanacetum coccineum]